MADTAAETTSGACRRGAERPAYWSWQTLERHSKTAVKCVAGVAMEELIRALAALDHDGAGFSGKARYEMLWDGCPVCQRLILVLGDDGEGVLHVGLIY